MSSAKDLRRKAPNETVVYLDRSDRRMSHLQFLYCNRSKLSDPIWARAFCFCPTLCFHDSQQHKRTELRCKETACHHETKSIGYSSCRVDHSFVVKPSSEESFRRTPEPWVHDHVAPYARRSSRNRDWVAIQRYRARNMLRPKSFPRARASVSDSEVAPDGVYLSYCEGNECHIPQFSIIRRRRNTI